MLRCQKAPSLPGLKQLWPFLGFSTSDREMRWEWWWGKGKNEFNTQFPGYKEEREKGRRMDIGLRRIPENENLEMDLSFNIM